MTIRRMTGVHPVAAAVASEAVVAVCPLASLRRLYFFQQRSSHQEDFCESFISSESLQAVHEGFWT